MRHLLKGRHLNRKPPHRIALLRNLASRLFAHERIITTVAKAKELRPVAERLITIAKRANAAAETYGKETAEGKLALVNARRRIAQLLGGSKVLPVKDSEINIVNKVVNDLGVRYANRPGGYTRVLKRVERRVGDAAPTAFIELVGATEESTKTTASKAKAKS